MFYISLQKRRMKTVQIIIAFLLFCGSVAGQENQDAFLIDLDADATVERWEKEDIKVEIYLVENDTRKYVMEQIVPKSEYAKPGKTDTIIISTVDIAEWTANITYQVYIPKAVELTIESEHVTIGMKKQ